MDILEAMRYLKKGYKITRNEWRKDLYCVLNKETNLIEFFEGNRKIEGSPTFTTIDVLKDDWKFYFNENINCTFGKAIEHIKKGGKAKREGWNGKEQFISLATDIKCTDKSINFLKYCSHSDIGSQAILFHGTRGIQIGWLASQSDMLANDWIIF